MPLKVNILIVDDHPFIIEAYKNAIKGYNSADYEFTITQANDCRSGYDNITSPQNGAFNIAFFDISMPPYEEKNIHSGEDLAMLIKKEMPDCKIILLTMHTELLKISNIVKNINPNGLIIKNDLTFDELLTAFDKILHEENYYSQTVVKLISQIQYDNIDVDQFDKQILYHLSKGTKTKDIPSYVPLSLSAIEKRKLNLKETFNIKGGSDIDLIREAKNKGLL
ncbi:response regulator transcription factor [Flavobacterium sp. MAH-1]|uniref:Response regulator transcription factor n=1 Tax=Flavobacterium agri TaxID=2743471 RepID=A0A7Y8Y2T3_9FLAO|nr:response regulator [Flavobacterium agri]NUY81353.1 response regulator transcription factor [Flavobacterium agri]NYA71377.1 response regulator transcription factor [Flavobacterium agri]